MKQNRGYRKKTRFIGAALALVLGLFAGVTFPATPAGAATYPCYYGIPGNYFAGHVGPANAGQVGASAVITTQWAQSYCAGHAGNFASAWSMIASTSVGGYAQAGYDSALCGLYGCGSRFSPHYFTQARANGASTAETWVGPASGLSSNNLYWAYMDVGCSCARMVIGYITYIQSSSFNPFVSWSGTQTQWLNEASDPLDHIFGSSGAHVGWTTVKQLPFGGSWSGSLGATASVNNSGFLWASQGITNPCLNGYPCWDTWANN